MKVNIKCHVCRLLPLQRFDTFILGHDACFLKFHGTALDDVSPSSPGFPPGNCLVDAIFSKQCYFIKVYYVFMILVQVIFVSGKVEHRLM